MKKTYVLIFGLIGILVFIVSMYPVNFGICNKIAYECRKTADSLQMLFSIFPFLFFFSLITYKMPEEVFRAWWRFVVWFFPIIVIVTFLQNIEHQQSGFAGVTQGAFETFILLVLYAVFIIVSVARIIITVRKIKKQSSN